MGSVVIERLGDNIVSPIGLTSTENLESILSGRSELRLRPGEFNLPEDCCASLLDREAVEKLFKSEEGEKDYTFFEKLCILSARHAIAESSIDPSASDTLFVLSTTKGNVDELAVNLDSEKYYIGHSAGVIARHFGNRNTPVVASNACISGVCAQISAVRQLLSGRYRTAVVIGADVLSQFIISGFQSFKALSQQPCRPYDRDRVGLNLGEAVGTLVLQIGEKREEIGDGTWIYVASAIHNDANHISGPSRTGEGSYRVLRDILDEIDPSELAFVNTHGTATAYNDEMESIALHRAGLDTLPVNGLKGFYGHTLGAAGVIETVLSMHAIDRGLVLPTRGFATQGTTYAVNLSADTRSTDKKAFIKLLSGFGGSNAGIAWRKGGAR